MLKQLGCTILIILMWSTSLCAATFYVDQRTLGMASGARNAPYVTISRAIGSASYGDEVYVSAGYYVENIVMKDGVNVIAIDGPEATIIDGSSAVYTSYKTDAFIGHTILAADAVLDGFTITGAGSGKKGILAWGESPTLLNLIIENNAGGGLDVHAIRNYLEPTVDSELVSAPLIDSIIIRDNGGTGAFFGSFSSGAVLKNSEIYDNSGWELAFYNTVQLEGDTVQDIIGTIVEGVLATGASSDILIDQASAPNFSPEEVDIHVEVATKNGYGYGDANHTHVHKNADKQKGKHIFAGENKKTFNYKFISYK